MEFGCVSSFISFFFVWVFLLVFECRFFVISGVGLFLFRYFF